MNTDVIIIGGGATGLFTALDLSLRGLNVILFERGDIGAGTSGKFHGMLHSGARYAVNDPHSAIECIQENKILSTIAPQAIVDTGGIFVGITDDDVKYSDEFIKALKKVGIEHKVLTKEETLQEEPLLNKELKLAIWVPDKVIRGYDLLSLVAIHASLNGARIKTYNEVVDFIKEGGEVRGVRVKDHISGEIKEYRSDFIVNTSGPHTFKILEKLGIKDLPALFAEGAMLVYKKPIVSHIINRLRLPSDGDIIVPYSDVSILGTTAKLIEDPENYTVDQNEIETLIKEGSIMVPSISNMKYHRIYSSIRVLYKRFEKETGRTATRDFVIIDHEKEHGIRGILSIFGGKFTTSRLMGERVGDLVTEKLGLNVKSRTRNYQLNIPENLEYLAEKLGVPKILYKLVLSRLGSLDEDRYLYVNLSTFLSYLSQVKN